jgi:hypothetical protein
MAADDSMMTWADCPHRGQAQRPNTLIAFEYLHVQSAEGLVRTYLSISVLQFP